MTRPRPVMLAVRLGAIGLIAVAGLQGVHHLTAPSIAEARRQQLRDALSLALPPAHFDEAIENSAVEVRARRWLGDDVPLRVYRARLGGRPSGLIIEAVAPDGYGGPIRLLIGIDADGRVQGVRLTEHRETPGLGDYVDPLRSDWASAFLGRALGDPPAARWRIDKEGGAFPHVAGATISPRAVTLAVRRALQFVAQHDAALQAAPPGSLLEFDDGP